MASRERICLALDLKDDPDLIAQYEHHHKEVWPEILDSIRSSGIVEMEIYRTGNRLFMIMEVNEDFDVEKKASLDAQKPKVQEWEQLMDTFQQRLAWAPKDVKWVRMDKIFQL